MPTSRSPSRRSSWFCWRTRARAAASTISAWRCPTPRRSTPSTPGWPRPGWPRSMSGTPPAATRGRTNSGSRAHPTASGGRSTPSWKTAPPSGAKTGARAGRPRKRHWTPARRHKPRSAAKDSRPTTSHRLAPAAPDRAYRVTDVRLWRRLLAELLGSAFLAAVVIGSGIAAQRLSPGQTGLELLENATATAAGLFAIILMFGPVSGGHFNPVVSFVDAAFGGLRWRDAAAYLPAQVAGCIAGAVIANLMFALPAVTISAKHRATPAHFLSEVIATLGLLLVIFALARSGRARSAPAAVGAYIGAAYWFTSSTS